MAEKGHSIASVLSRHPIHGVSEFTDVSQRDAHTYVAADVGKVVQTGTGTGRRYWVVYDVVAGVGAFREVAPVSAGGTAFNWEPNAPPDSPGSDDIYFENGDWGSFSEWDPSGSIAVSVDSTSRMGKLVQTGNGNIRWGGMYRPVPASEFAFAAQVNIVTPSGTSAQAVGIMVAGDIVGNPTTADFRTCDMVHATGNEPVVRARSWDAYNGNASSTTSVTSGALYFRARVNSTTCHMDYSFNGVEWIRVDVVTLGFTPAYYGVVILALESGAESTARIRFVKTFSGAGSAGYDSTKLGRGVLLPTV